MYKMLIIDDNTWAREGIRDTLDWTGMGIEISGVFANGKQALEKMSELNPDLILTDIAMPIMNGIELAKELKEHHPEIKVVFMSSYNEFNFARSAIDLDIYGYVLKPIMPEKLMEVIKKIIAVITIEDSDKKGKEEMAKQLNDSLPLLQEQLFRDLAFGMYNKLEEIQKRLEFLKIFLVENFSIQLASISINNYDEMVPNMSVDDKYSAVYSIKKLLNSFSETYINIYSFQVSEKEFAALLFFNNFYNFTNQRDILDIIIAMKEKIYDKLGFITTIGISNVSQELVNLPDLYRQSTAAVKTGFYGDKVQIIQYKEIEIIRKGIQDKELDLQALYSELNDLISYGDKEIIWEFVVKYFGAENTVYSENYIKSLSFSIINIIQIILFEVNESLKSIFGESIVIWLKLESFETILDIRQWIYNILLTVKNYLSKKHNSINQQIVEDIKKIISIRYMDQFTVNDIADTVYFSALQANNIFKSETGKTIFDYLTEYRIGMAKELLKSPYTKIYTVSQKVGYTNKSHFCMIFKKYIGLTPTEFKNKAVL